MNKIKKTRMKFTDYIRLSSLSVKARKRSTKNTVFGMSFGLILLIPMIFFAIAFYTDLSLQVNSIKTASELNIPLKNINDGSSSIPYKDRTTDADRQEGLSAFSNFDDLIEMEEATEYILSQYCSLPLIYSYGDDNAKLILGGEEFIIGSTDPNSNNNYNNQSSGMSKMKIIFPEESTSNMFTEAELYDYKQMTGKSTPFVSGCSNGFTESTNGKNEIIISEKLIELWGIDKDEIGNEEISIKYPKFKLGDYYKNFMIDNDYTAYNELIQSQPADPEYELYLCYNFKVVGIIKDDYFTMPGKEEEAQIWVTAPSVYYPEDRYDYKAIDYTITYEDMKGTYITFNDDIEDMLEANVDNQYMFLMQGMANLYTESYSRSGMGFKLNNMNLTLQIKDYAMLATVLPLLKNDILKVAYSDMTANDFPQVVANEVYTVFNMIDQIGKILIIVFMTIGGIIFFTNMLNLLNTVRYSVESRKNYIGVLRAIGTKSRVIPRLYICEMLIIFFKTLIRVAIFGTILSYLIKFGLDKGLAYIATIAEFKINFLYYPVALGGTFLVTTIIGTFFARISCKVTAYQPILKTLFDEK